MKLGKTIFLSIVGILTVAGFLFVLLPAELTITMLNPIAPDDEIASLTIPLIHQLQPVCLFLSIVLLIIFLLFLFKKTLFIRTLFWINRQWHEFLHDSRQTISIIWKHMHNRRLWLDVLFLFGIALTLRFLKLERPLEHDEAFTYYVFARLPYRYIIADYSFPNNHIFHTLLVKASVAILDNHTWAIRLPAYLFGSAVSPLLYLFARYTTHKQKTSLLAGGFAALYPYMILTDVNARGYSIMVFFTILAALLSDDMMKHKNRFLWFCFSLVIVLGLWTIPIMLLPAGGLYVWVLWLGLRHQHDRAYGNWGWFKYVFGSGVLVVTGTILVYLPVLLHSGLNSLIANPIITSLSTSEFIPTLGDRLKDIWNTWQGDLPLYIMLPVAAIMFLAFIHPDKKICHSNGVILSLLAFLVLFSAIYKQNLWPRVVYYLAPFLVMTLAFGFSTLWQWIGHNWKQNPFIYGGILILAVASLIKSPNYSPIGNRVIGETEQQTQWLSNNRHEDQIILMPYPEDMPFSVYSEQYGIPPSAIRWEQPFRGAYVIINKAENQTVESVITNNGPEIYFFDLTQTQTIQNYPNSALYYLPSHWDLVENAYK